MRIIYFLFFLLCYTATVKAQVPSDAVAAEDDAFNAVYAHRSVATVTGTLLNVTAGECKDLVISYSLVTPFSSFQLKKTASVDADGRFSLELDYRFPYQQIWFSLGEFFYAGLYATKDLHLELDMKKIRAAKEINYNGDGVRYLGTDGPLNVYLNNYVLYNRPEQLRLSGRKSELIYSRTVGDILPAYNKLSDSIKQIEDSYIAANPSPYSWMLENERMSDYYAQIWLKYFGKIMPDSLWQKMKQHKGYLLSNNSTLFYNYMALYIAYQPGGNTAPAWTDVALLQNLNKTEKAVIDSLRNGERQQPSYSYTPENIQRWIKQLQPRMQDIARTWSVERSIKKVDSMFAPAKADFLKLRLTTSLDISEQKMTLEHILPGIHTAWCAALLKGEYKRTTNSIDEVNKTLAMATPGTQYTVFGTPLIETSFGATLYNASGVKALDFLAKLKQLFPGKAIIIDRWATWCGPCLSEMAHSKQLQEESKDLPVVFVYLCTINGSTETKWKLKVAELKQPGIHFLIDEKLDAEISNHFSFNGYPGYAFIDKAGVYKPGAFMWMSQIENKDALAALIAR